MDLRRHNRPPNSARHFMQPSAPQQMPTPQLFEDTSQYVQYDQSPGAFVAQQPLHASTPNNAPRNDWQGYSVDIGDYGSQGLPPYDPFGQQQRQPSFNNNPSPIMMMGGTSGGVPYPPQSVGTVSASSGGSFPLPQQQQQQQQIFNPQQFLNDPMASMAFQYGQTLAGQGRNIMQEKIERYVSFSMLRFYFAVNTSYVWQKLILLTFPFAHKDWTPKFNQDQPLPPMYDINAPDLYIPTMAFVSYILLSAYMMGLQGQFSPEVLGMKASSGVGTLAFEILLTMTALYIFNINTYLKLYDLLAFCGYKFVGILFVLLASLLAGRVGYLIALIYGSLSFGFFLLRALRIAFLSNPGTGHFGEGPSRSLYLLFGLCLFQPLVIWFMTYSLQLQAPATDSGS